MAFALNRSLYGTIRCRGLMSLSSKNGIQAFINSYKSSSQSILCRNANNLDSYWSYQSSNLSTGITRGQDLLADSLTFGTKRKIILDSYLPTGIDVIGMLHYPPQNNTIHSVEASSNNDEKVKNNEESIDRSQQTVHMNGSIIAFPHSCYLWNVSNIKDITLESLSIVILHDPSVEYLFIGSDKPLPPRELNRIKKEMKIRNILVDHMDVTNAMGTFNILNGEDRRVAVALFLEIDTSNDSQ